LIPEGLNCGKNRLPFSNFKEKSERKVYKKAKPIIE